MHVVSDNRAADTPPPSSPRVRGRWQPRFGPLEFGRGGGNGNMRVGEPPEVPGCLPVLCPPKDLSDPKRRGCSHGISPPPAGPLKGLLETFALGSVGGD